MRDDLLMWLKFLQQPAVFCRPFMDFSKFIIADEVDMYSNASGKLGMGALCGEEWMYKMWPAHFLQKYKPSIEYLELFAVTAGVLAWIHKFKNRRIILFCDNKSVVDMINITSTSCRNCMVLIRLIVLKGLNENVRIFAKHVSGVSNGLADSLCRNRIEYFHQLCEVKGRKMKSEPVEVPQEIWPVETIWKK